MSLVRFRSKALGYDNCSYLSAFHEFQKTLKSACNLGKPVVRYEMSERQQFNMREWLSWWSTTLPRSGSRVRVPSRALNDKRRGIRNGCLFFVFNKDMVTLPFRCFPYKVNIKKKQGFTFALKFSNIVKKRVTAVSVGRN